jgi:hypothetical protein
MDRGARTLRLLALARLVQPIPETADPGAASAASADPKPDVELLVTRYLEETGRIPYWARLEPGKVPSGMTILALSPERQLAFVHAALAWSTQAAPTGLDHTGHLPELLSQIVKRRLPYEDKDVVHILDRLTYLIRYRGRVHLGGFLHAIEKYVTDHGATMGIQHELGSLRDALHNDANYWGGEGRKQVAQIDTMFAGPHDADFALDRRDDWGAHATDALQAMDADTRRRWMALLTYAATASGSKPSGVWLKGARAPIASLGDATFVDLTVAWLGLIGQSRPERPAEAAWYRRDDGFRVPSSLLIETNGDVLKGLAWCCTLVTDARLPKALSDAVEASFKKIPNYGAPSAKVGNACVWALGALPGTSGVAQLSRLEQRIKLPSARKMIESALDAAAQRNGVTREDLEESTVPSFGLENGRLSRAIGGYVAEISLTGGNVVDLTWRTADGKILRAEPAEVKRGFPNERKAITRLAEDVRKTLSAQRDRLETLILAEREWDLAAWRERYLDHPLLRILASSLIWSFRSSGHTQLGSWLDGSIVDVQDRPLETLDDDSRVRLWHPLGSEPAVVLAWREWLQRHEVTQPFKQAHREIYLLTDAERATETYSNRFAAHILRQHQLAALCQQRGWRYELQGMWDGANTPSLDLPRWDLRAELWCEGVEDPEQRADSGVFRYVTTDQVRFSRIGRSQPVRLADVPPLVFTEVMRDVDLFVGVCSIGADPTWGLRDADPRRNYWREFAFGVLSESAATRRDVLARLLPRLTKLKGRWELADRFLVIRGDRRTYKIHLGSGNILMEPNDHYLCIVPRAGGELGSDQIFLPFDGDTVLSVILSKAFLLADDRSIKDPSILRQIGL